jgi:hypothetical protein
MAEGIVFDNKFVNRPAEDNKFVNDLSELAKIWPAAGQSRGQTGTMSWQVAARSGRIGAKPPKAGGGPERKKQLRPPSDSPSHR